MSDMRFCHESKCATASNLCCLNFVRINRESKVIFAKIEMFGRFRDKENFLENENFRENEMSRNFVFCENEKGIFVSTQVQVVRN
jgi:hypothetical protein